MTREFISEMFTSLDEIELLAKDALAHELKKDQFVVIEKHKFTDLIKAFLLAQEKLLRSANMGSSMVDELVMLRIGKFNSDSELIKLRAKVSKLKSVVKDFFPELNIELWTQD